MCRWETILIVLQVMSAKFHDDPILREYGLKVHTEMEKVQGRVLEAPSIKYKEEIPVRNMYIPVV